jgi:hypothetical protein
MASASRLMPLRCLPPTQWRRRIFATAPMHKRPGRSLHCARRWSFLDAVATCKAGSVARTLRSPAAPGGVLAPSPARRWAGPCPVPPRASPITKPPLRPPCPERADTGARGLHSWPAAANRSAETQGSSAGPLDSAGSVPSLLLPGCPPRLFC